MTHNEAVAFNAGIEAMRAIARAAADKIETTDPRQLPTAFAIVSLRQLAHDAEHLLLPTGGGRPDSAATIQGPRSPTGTAAAAVV